ncbi:MAG: hypothetical protein H7Y04_01845 [Verrucomicrobia bacterium]|nr:hypothetical protein [Cytophagales bacterium]
MSYKKSLLPIIFGLSLLFYCLSCKKEETNPFLFSSIEWNEFKIPEAGTVFCMTGNIDDEIYVSGFKNDAYFTTNKGKNWSKVAGQCQGGIIQGFLVSADTLFALTCGLGNKDGDFLGCPSSYTLKSKKEWRKKNHDIDDKKYWIEGSFISPRAKASNGTVYFLSYIKESGNRQQLNKIFNRDTTFVLQVPLNNNIRSLYIDKQDRLYLGMNQVPANGKVASLYVSKKPLP